MATPTLISSGRMIPRKVIGTVDTSEFLVALAASLGFIIGIGSEAINFTTVAGLLIGGVVAAPIAAYLVRHIPGRLLGSLVGGIIIITNARTLMSSFEIDGAPRAAIYVTLFAVWAIAISISVRGLRRDSAEERACLRRGRRRPRRGRAHPRPRLTSTPTEHGRQAGRTTAGPPPRTGMGVRRVCEDGRR